MIILKNFNFILLIIFGIYATASFVNVIPTKKNIAVLSCFFVLTALAQRFCFSHYGIEITGKLYPFIMHLPLVLLIAFYFKKDFFDTILAMMITYLLCQFGKWNATFILSLTHKQWAYTVTYSITIIALIYLIHKSLNSIIRMILEKDLKSKLVISFLPITFYLYDYLFIIYTNLRKENNPVVFELLPLVLAASYLLFCIIYFKEYEKKQEIEHYNQILNIQQQQSRKFMESIQKSEQELSILRHDLRHFLQNIAILIKDNETQKALSYISEIIAKSDQTILHKYCENKMLNAILSYYSEVAKQKQIHFKMNIHITNTLPASDIDFTSVISNALKNAIHAVEHVKTEDKFITLTMIENNDRFLITVENTFAHKPVLINGIPISDQNGHGLGCQSIVNIVHKLKGQYQFSTKDNLFILKIIL
ncbi:MAG: GHKL domain-containing protein [Erysipelotrichia bacterium]|nr:GHKL domain-containing protein [Erysipelotrichia bacterium]NCC54593.1 GHKL domain-containing protein [Erysipelotrichia bacterium]